MRQRRSSQERRDQISQAVIALAAQHGLESVSVAQVARRVGVAPSALYRHFPNKEAMLETTMERLGTRMLENIERARAERGGALDVLERFLTLHVTLLREHRGMPYLLFSNSMRSSPGLRSRFLAHTVRLRSEVESLLVEGQNSGEVRADLDPRTGALMFVGTFLPPAILWNLSEGRFDITAQVRRNWEFYREAVRKRRAQPPRPGRAAKENQT